MINLQKIPEILTTRKQWVLWKLVDKGDGRPTKVPFQPSGQPAKANTPDTWSTFLDCVTRYERGGFDGIGFEFSNDDEFCGIDLDGCRDPASGKVETWAKDIILEVDTYAEVSPSQTGVKLFVVGKSPLQSGRKKILTDTPKCGDKTPAIEVYDWGRYFAVTGWRLAGQVDPQPRQEQLTGIVKRLWPEDEGKPREYFYGNQAVLERARKYVAKLPPAVSGQGGHDVTFKAACVLALGFGLPEPEAMQVLGEWNQTCQPPWSDKDLVHKVRDAAKQSGERNYLRNVQPQNWEGIKLPEYKTKTNPKPEPRITTLAQAARNYITSIEEGKTDLIELGLPDVDYAIGGGVERGELVILAARPSHGKSAAALQCAHHWTAEQRGVVMISEEMSSLALGKRTIQFVSDTPEEHWRTSLPLLKNQITSYGETHASCLIAESCGTAESACEQIEKAVSEFNVQCAIVDYAQILRSPGKSRYEQVTATSILLKQTAIKHNIVLLMLCQLSREIESRTKFTPVMSDIKETGQLEQDADVIMFLVWPHRIDNEKPAGEYLFFIAKNRNRAINQACVKARFLPARQMIVHPKIQESRNYEPSFDNWNQGADDGGFPR